MPSLRIYRQGALDWLCGPYAIVHALQLCEFKNTDRVFRLCCEVLPRDAIWRGVNLGHMKTMLAACAAGYPKLKRFHICEPFEDRQPSGDRQFWAQIDFMLGATATICAIAKLNKPIDHWTVLPKQPSSGRLMFIDSLDERGRFWKNRAALGSGLRRDHPREWLIDRRDFILIQRPQHGRSRLPPPEWLEARN